LQCPMELFWMHACNQKFVASQKSLSIEWANSCRLSCQPH
jgi:hypothetical protein